MTEIVKLSDNQVTLSYEIFQNPKMFESVMAKINACTNFPGARTVYRIRRLTDALVVEYKKFLGEVEEIKKLVDPKDEEKMKVVDERFKTLLATLFTIKWSLLDEKEVDCIDDVSPSEVDVLKHISTEEAFV